MCSCTLLARAGRCMYGCTGRASTADTKGLCERCYEMGCESSTSRAGR